MAARGIEPEDLLAAVGLADEDDDAVDPEVLDLLDDRDLGEDRR